MAKIGEGPPHFLLCPNWPLPSSTVPLPMLPPSQPDVSLQYLVDEVLYVGRTGRQPPGVLRQAVAVGGVPPVRRLAPKRWWGEEVGVAQLVEVVGILKGRKRDLTTMMCVRERHKASWPCWGLADEA